MTQHIFVILRGRYLVADVGIFKPTKRQALVGTTTTVSSQRIAVRLDHGLPPRLSVTKGGIAVEAVIGPTSPAQRGALWYVDSVRCGSFSTGTLEWAIAAIWELCITHKSSR